MKQGPLKGIPEDRCRSRKQRCEYHCIFHAKNSVLLWRNWISVDTIAGRGGDEVTRLGDD